MRSDIQHKFNLWGAAKLKVTEAEDNLQHRFFLSQRDRERERETWDMMAVALVH